MSYSEFIFSSPILRLNTHSNLAGHHKFCLADVCKPVMKTPLSGILWMANSKMCSATPDRATGKDGFSVPYHPNPRHSTCLVSPFLNSRLSTHRLLNTLYPAVKKGDKRHPPYIMNGSLLDEKTPVTRSSYALVGKTPHWGYENIALFTVPIW